ncbi:MAG: MerR family transcriptional regulator, partial [Gemmatimonadaceae bacterium]|nr:MerR family transcriptional regulator [Gemmatimonadaceae bacterium]
MRVVCRRTGLSAELLRVWERRHQVVKPSRTQTGRRLYSDAEIERLALLYRATLGGRTIGHVAGLSNPALALLVRQDAEAEAAQGEPGQRPVSPAADATAVVGEALRANREAKEKRRLGASRRGAARRGVRSGSLEWSGGGGAA